MNKQFIEAGKIVNTHGLTGELKIVPWADSPEFLLDFDTFYIDEAPIKVKSARIHKQNLLIFFEGVEDINAAMRLRDKVLWIDRTEVELPEGKNFIADLFGLEVRDADSGAVLGKLDDILTPSSQSIYLVRGGAREIMIPAVDAFIIETNVAEGFIRVRLIEGM